MHEERIDMESCAKDKEEGRMEEWKATWKETREDSVKAITSVLRHHEYDMQSVLADIVASLCDVDVTDMLSSSNKQYLSQARWLFWYAYRFLTQETYEKIAVRTTVDGHTFRPQSIFIGINNMGRMISAANNVWYIRWELIKSIIKEDKNNVAVNSKRGGNGDYVGDMEGKKMKVKIVVPENVEIDIIRQVK